MPQQVIAIIPARYGSSRFPGKPLFPIMGKTLIQWTYENAMRCTSLHHVVIATDDQRIYDHVTEFGATAVMTSPYCPTGTDRLIEVLQTNRYCDTADIIINVQGDEPCIDPLTIQKVVDVLVEEPQIVMSTAIAPITTEEEAYNHSVVKCVIDKNQYALYFSRALIPSGKNARFSPHTNYYKHIGIYGYRRHFLLSYGELNPTPLQIAEDLEQLKVLEHGYKIKTAIVNSPSIGVDTPHDIQKVEQYLCR